MLYCCRIATRLLSTTAVRHADAETYLYKKPEVIHVPKTQEEISMERAKKLRNWESANEIFYGPERDLKNFPHPKMAVESPKNHLGFIPTNWFKALYPKTGVTGISNSFLLHEIYSKCSKISNTSCLLNRQIPNKITVSTG